MQQFRPAPIVDDGSSNTDYSHVRAEYGGPAGEEPTGHVAYVARLADTDTWQVVYARQRRASPQEPEHWEKQVVAESSAGFEGLDLALANGRPAMSYYDHATRMVMYAECGVAADADTAGQAVTCAQVPVAQAEVEQAPGMVTCLTTADLTGNGIDEAIVVCKWGGGAESQVAVLSRGGAVGDVEIGTVHELPLPESLEGTAVRDPRKSVDATVVETAEGPRLVVAVDLKTDEGSAVYIATATRAVPEGPDHWETYLLDGGKPPIPSAFGASVMAQPFVLDGTGAQGDGVVVAYFTCPTTPDGVCREGAGSEVRLATALTPYPRSPDDWDIHTVIRRIGWTPVGEPTITNLTGGLGMAWAERSATDPGQVAHRFAFSSGPSPSGEDDWQSMEWTARDVANGGRAGLRLGPATVLLHCWTGCPR